MDFFNSDYYINSSRHRTFCKTNDSDLNELNSMNKSITKCLIEKSKNTIKCNTIGRNYNIKKTSLLATSSKLSFNYKINYANFNKKEGTYINDDEYNKIIEYNKYNKKYNNDIYLNENNNKNMTNIQAIIIKNDEFLKSLSNDEIKTLQYYTYKGDIFLNYYITNSKFNIDDNIQHTEVEDYHMFFSEELDDYLFKVQMLKIFSDKDDIIDKIKSKTLNNYDLSETDYKKIFKNYLSDMKNIFIKAPKIEKDLYLYRGIEINYIYDNIIDDENVDKQYKNKYFLSTSLFVEKAYKYTKKQNRIICRFKINSGMPIIFVEGITLASGDMEVIVPNNTILKLLDENIKKHLYNSNNTFTKDIICPREYSDFDIIDVIDFNVEL